MTRSADALLFPAALFGAGVVLYAVGLAWGLPLANAPGFDMPWGSDELGPVGAVAELHRVFLQGDGARFNPQYPLLAQWLQAGCVGLYLVWLRLTGGFLAPSAEYPFGLVHPEESLATMTVFARLPSLLLGAGVPVLAYSTARELWGERAGRFAGVATLLLYPLGYYARTSNVDAPALFLTALGVYVFARCLTRGADARRLLAFGAVAALASATKDASYAVFAAAGAALGVRELRAAAGAPRRIAATLGAFAGAFFAAALVYAVASGLVFSLARFREHVAWVVSSSAAQVHPATAAGFLGFLREIGVHLLDSLGLPLLLASVAGVALAVRSRARDAWLLLPAAAVIALTVLPVHFVNIRYVLASAYLLALFSGRSIAALRDAASPALRRAGAVAAAVVIGWSALRAVDLAVQMRHDSRVDLAAWLTENARAGETLAYFGARQKLPRVDLGLRFVQADEWCAEALWRGPGAPELVALIPMQHFEVEHEFSLSDARFAALRDGALGYALVYRSEGPGWFARRPIPFVNPPLLVFARADRARSVAVRREPPARRALAFTESWLGLEPGPPRGLQPNPERPLPCSAEWMAGARDEGAPSS